MNKRRRNPLRTVGRTATGIPIVGGLFKLADTYGFPLADSILQARKIGVAPGLPAYVADAVLAGWPVERAIGKVMEALKDLGEFPSPTEWAELERGLRIAAAQPRRFGSAA